MPAKSKQQQKFFGVVKSMQKGDIPKKGDAGEVADDMTKKEVDKMASTKHKGLPKKIKEMVEEEIQALHEVKPFVDNRLRTKYDYPKGNRDGLVYLATNDNRYPTEIVLYNQKRDVFHFVYSHNGEFTAGNAKTQTVPRKGFNSTHYVMPYFEEWEEDLGYERGFYEGKVNELKTGNKINKARAKAHFKQGEKIAVVHKATKNAMPIEDIKQIDTFDTKEYDFAYITEGKLNEGPYNDPALKSLRTQAKGTKFPKLSQWCEYEPEDIMSAVYWAKGQMPPTDKNVFEKEWSNIVKQLHVKFPIPADAKGHISNPDMMEAKMTPAKVQKAQRELVATIQLLKKNFPMYKAAKESGDEKKLEKHRKIALDLTKKKKQLELNLDKALGGLYQDAELDLKEAAPRMRKDPYVEKLRLLYKDVAKLDRQMNTADRSRYSHVKRDWNKALKAIASLTNTLNRKGATIPEGKLTEALPKFKTPYDAYKWIMDKREEAMDIEMDMLQKTKDIIQTQKDMEQEASPEGGPTTDRYGAVLEKLQMEHEALRKQFAAIMAEIDEYDQGINY